MCIFQSEQVIKLANVQVLLVKWPPNSADLKQLDYHVWDTTLGCYQKYMP